MLDFCKKETVDLFMLSKTNTKWNTKIIQIMENKFKYVRKRPKSFTSDSKVELKKVSDFLPRGTLTMLSGRLQNFVLSGSAYSHPQGYLNSFKIHGKDKVVLILTCYRITKTLSNGVLTVKH